MNIIDKLDDTLNKLNKTKLTPLSTTEALHFNLQFFYLSSYYIIVHMSRKLQVSPSIAYGGKYFQKRKEKFILGNMCAGSYHNIDNIRNKDG